MGRRRAEKRPCVYVADTEATTMLDYRISGRVYAYILDMQSVRTARMTKANACTMSEEMTFSGPATMNEWVEEFLEKIPEQAFLWYYNTRYDISFIIWELMHNHGYTSDDWKAKTAREEAIREARDRYKAEHPECRVRGRIVDGELSIVQGRAVPESVAKDWAPRKKIHPVRSGSGIILCEIWNSKGHKLTIGDVGNKWTNLPDWDEKRNAPMSGVAAIARMYGGDKAPLEDHVRGKDYMPDEEEITRCTTDTKWIRLAMEQMYDMGLEEITLASDAWKIFQCIRKVGIGKDRSGTAKAKLGKMGISVEPGSFPDDGIMSDLPEVWSFDDGYILDMRDAYMGGVTIVNKKYQGKELKTKKGMRIAHDDCNSMHPASMECSMPYGACWMSYKEDGDWWVKAQQVTAKLKKGCFPTVTDKGRQDMTIWMEEIDQELIMTKEDWEWLEKNYAVHPIGKAHYLCWHTRVNESLTTYVNHFVAEKAKWKVVKDDENRDKDERVKGDIMYYLSKILMNALYGKFGQDPVKAYNWCIVDEKGLHYKESNIRMGEFDDPEWHKYLPMACAITACSRNRLWSHFEALGWQNVIYGDTDSAFYWCPCETQEELLDWLKDRKVEVHPTKLGAWDVEHGLKEGKRLTVMKPIRAKVYGLKQENGTLTIKAAGLPIKAKKAMQSLDDLYIGAVFIGAKLMPMNVPGGQVLVETDFTLNER